MNTVLKTAAVALMVSGLTACGSTAVKQSGFLQNYGQLKADPKFDDALRFQATDVNLASYSAMVVDPVVVHFSPDADGNTIDPTRLKEVTDYFDEAISKTLPKLGLKKTTQSGPGVLRLRVAVTNISETVPIANIHPAMKLSGLGLGGAAMEAEIVDSVSGKRVIAIVESRQGDRLGIAAGLQSLGQAKQVIVYWVERAVEYWPKKC